MAYLLPMGDNRGTEMRHLVAVALLSFLLAGGCRAKNEPESATGVPATSTQSAQEGSLPLTDVWAHGLDQDERRRFEEYWQEEYGTEPTTDPRASDELHFGPLREMVQSADGIRIQDRNEAWEYDNRSFHHLKAIVAAATDHGVPWQVLYGVLHAESGFDPGFDATTRNGKRRVGIGGIDIAAIGVSDADALNPLWAIDHVAGQLSAKRKQYFPGQAVEWGLVALAQHRPEGADHIWRDPGGRMQAGFEWGDFEFIRQTFGFMEFGEGLGFNPESVHLDWYKDPLGRSMAGPTESSGR